MNITIRRRLWQVLWWPRRALSRGVWPRHPKPTVFRYWIVGRYESPERA
jgi:hypothetical protein